MKRREGIGSSQASLLSISMKEGLVSEKQPLVITNESHAVAILMGEAIDLCNERGKNYNAGKITKDSYNVFPLRYHAGEMHKEALRACSWVEQGNIAKIREHVRDVVVWAAFLYEETSHYKELDDAMLEAIGYGAIELESQKKSKVVVQEHSDCFCGESKHPFASQSQNSQICVCGHSKSCFCHAERNLATVDNRKKRLMELRAGMCSRKHKFTPNDLPGHTFADYCDECGHSKDSDCHEK